MRKIPLIPALAKPTLALLCCIVNFPVVAQEGDMASALRESGKIYVVVGVILIIFIGLVFYLVRVDRKIRKLEEAQNDKSTEQ